MAAKLCKYGCQTLLEGFDEEQRKFLEAGTGGLHTKERCQEAKAKLAQKADHGNEEVFASKGLIDTSPAGTYYGITKEDKYVDHTAARPSKVKIFHAENSDLVEIEYNKFLESKTFQWTRAQLGAKGNEFAIALYYEEVK